MNKPEKNLVQATEPPRDIQDDCGGKASIVANKAVLEGIAALQSNFQLFKLEIVEVIDKRLDQFSASIKAELTALKKETDVTISAMKTRWTIKLKQWPISKVAQHLLRIRSPSYKKMLKS